MAGLSERAQDRGFADAGTRTGSACAPRPTAPANAPFVAIGIVGGGASTAIASVTLRGLVEGDAIAARNHRLFQRCSAEPHRPVRSVVGFISLAAGRPRSSDFREWSTRSGSRPDEEPGSGSRLGRPLPRCLREEVL